ncbi:TPA: hypothetical protein MYP60_002497 [Citrobacter farmeri]|uniref:hypothetical protein n=1 Tax=Citrobacter sp. Ca225 TaxID=2985002 RepID=UPI001A1BB264|nr:hypothetical protein [Citrobacter sp. Ca225]MBU5647797.1 hypothetical protein [Pluralibacter sp. S54_ASV_43]HAT3757154.1 hypothetical protein [Citrobacter amalonaticus]HAU5705737.1 hypothetical protein [Citrobacter freundii]HCB1598809.1 hypothetical protein [Citrobacter farmeri]MDM3519370.1 hypothetical protein [Citrobacter sp. Ca225]
MFDKLTNARHLSHDFIIDALIKTLSEEQLNAVTSSVQDAFDETFKRLDAGNTEGEELITLAKEHASTLLNKNIK